LAGSERNCLELILLEKDDDIIHFRYTNSINKETGPVIIGLQIKHKDDIIRILENMNSMGILYERIRNI
jgi:threonine dehydratase